MTILKEPVAAVLESRAAYKEAQAYYNGDVPETFATAKLRRAFRTTGDRSRLNFCRPVVDAVNDRLEIATISGDTKAATALIQKVWENNDLGLEAMEIHRMTLVNGDAYVMVWPDENGDVQISYNAPTNMTVVYDPENPRKMLYAVKMWRSGEAETRMNIYTDTEIRKYRTDSDEVTDGTNWFGVETIDNPFGQIPVFHFRTHRPFGRPEHYDAYDAQNAINKLFITNMFTIDYQGAPQRYALSQVDNSGEFTDFDEDQTERENIGSLKNGPGELWYLKGVHTVGEFKPADADTFWKPIEALRNTVASLTNTPAHYLSRGSYNPTGQSLRVAESPLLKKVHDREMSFGYTWRDVFRFILNIEGINSNVQVLWKTHESLDELERWDVTAKKINAGLSKHQALREGGYTEDQIKQIMSERLSEDETGINDYARNRAVRVDPNNNENNTLDTPNATDEQGN
jgi:hypothetical protein